MPHLIARLLALKAFHLFARVVLTFMFWGAGLAKLIDVEAGTAEMAFYGLQPAGPLNLLAGLTLLVGSALVIVDRAAWLGAGMLAVFTALTIPLVHDFWTMEGKAAIAHFHTATEHVTVIGAMMILAILSRRTSTHHAEVTTARPPAVPAASH